MGGKSRYDYFRTPKHHLEYTFRIWQNSICLINVSVNGIVCPHKVDEYKESEGLHLDSVYIGHRILINHHGPWDLPP